MKNFLAFLYRFSVKGQMKIQHLAQMKFKTWDNEGLVVKLKSMQSYLLSKANLRVFRWNLNSTQMMHETCFISAGQLQNIQWLYAMFSRNICVPQIFFRNVLIYCMNPKCICLRHIWFHLLWLIVKRFCWSQSVGGTRTKQI